MKIDLCKLLGVEEGEEFTIETKDNWFNDSKYKIENNILKVASIKYSNFLPSNFNLNDFIYIEKIIRLPKKKGFTEDELCILKNIDSEFNVLGKNINGTIFVTSDYEKTYLNPFNNLFQSLDIGEDIRIDDYVERRKKQDD